MDRFWQEYYPDGVIKDIDLDSPDTLNTLFDRVCSQYPENRAFTAHGHTIDFATTQKYIENLSQSFMNLGINKGDRVAVIMPNLIQYPLSIFALFKIGAIVVNINPLYVETEIDYILENSGAKHVIILDMMAHKLDNLYNKHNLKNVIVTKVPDIYPCIKRIVINFVLKYVKRAKTSHSYAALAWRDLLLDTKCSKHNMPTVIRDDLAFIQYTGATEGRAKGVMLSHFNIVANLAQIYAWLKPQIKDLDKQVVIDALPLYHIFSLTANLLTFFYLGSENVMIVNPRDTHDMIKTLNKTQFTIFSALDTLYNHLLKDNNFCGHKYPTFKYSVAGGMPIRAVTIKKWVEITNVTPTNCYGLSESSPAVSLNILGSPYDGSVGFPVPSLDIDIRDSKTNCSLAVGETGVIWIKGPQVTKGYWQNEVQTASVLDQNGWLNTHDLGYISPLGKLFISSRQSEMIIVSGFNVYPLEVENVLNNFNEIAEAAVFGVPDDETSEKIVAFITFKHGYEIDNDEILARCHKLLAAYKIPRLIYIKDELPKTLVGKVDKKKLKELITAHPIKC